VEAEAIILPVRAATEVEPESRTDTPSDEGATLIARYLAGEAVAFDAMMRLYRAPIYGFFRRSGASVEVADDLFQETFLRVHVHAASYTATRPFRVWLFTIAHNLLRSHWRKATVRRFLVGWWAGETDHAPELADHQAGPDEQTATRQSLRWLEKALAEVPERQRQALVLTQIEGLALEEAADVLGVPVNTVKTCVHRGRQALALARRAHEGDAG
jgi:RNA polymerase sigma-70 factor (ECF subfamily)